jgi:hypothetical protein
MMNSGTTRDHENRNVRPKSLPSRSPRCEEVMPYTMPTKPKLIFFQCKYDNRLPEFLLTHKREHVKCLSRCFEVTVIQEDCDYQQVCDRYEPDLTLFESGIKDFLACQPLKITSIRSCPQVPKLGLYHADSFSHARAGFLSDMDHWGIDTFFSISITAAEHMPEIADKLFVWPNFIDADTYRDYGEPKNIPVLFTGAKHELYPWRQQIMKLVSQRYPSLLCPHPGYDPGSAVGYMMVGERYARTINASLFVPACGTVAKEIVRKHFEVPACKACLITEKTPALAAAGFIDMANCVFADEHDVLDKLDHLFKDRERLEGIAKAGYQLVQSRHTLEHRDQIFQWFNLYKGLRFDQKIIQTGPFEPLIAVQKSCGRGNSHIISNGLHLTLLRQGDEKLFGGEYGEAERCYIKCLNYVRWMPEARLKLALCNLYQGNAKLAFTRIAESIEFTLAGYKAVDPDPVEWAYFVISLLCLGKLDVASKRAAEFEGLRHQELDRARWVTSVLTNREFRGASALNEDHGEGRRTIHQLPGRSLTEWIDQLCLILKACGQHGMIDALTKVEREAFNERDQTKRSGRQTAHRDKAPLAWFKRRMFYRTLRLRLKRCVADMLHVLERKWGYFLPYSLSESKNDEFFKLIRDLTREEDIKTAVLIGAVTGEGSTEAFVAGALENRNMPSVFCISGSRRGLINGGRVANSSRLKWYDIPLGHYPHDLSEHLEKTIKQIKHDHHINCFDVVLIDSSTLSRQGPAKCELYSELQGSKLIILNNINSSDSYHIHSQFLAEPTYVLIACNPGLRDGYAVFSKIGREPINNELESECAAEG